MRKFLKTVLFLFALSSIAYAEDDAMAILNKKRAEIEKAEKAKAKLAKEAEEKARKEAEEQAKLAEKEAKEKAKALLKIFDLDKYANMHAGNLPYGEQRKLEIARAMATEPKILLLDEPAAGMNPKETEDLMNTIKLIRDKFGIAVLLIEHDMKLVLGICERLVVLNYGQILASGDPQEVINNPKVVEAYLGKEEDE